MDSRYCTIIDGKEIPNWVTKTLDELDEWELRRRALWCEVCRMAKEMYKNPEQWVDRIKNPDHNRPWKYKSAEEPYVIWFKKYISDDYFYMKCKIKDFNLDEKAKAPLNDFTNRQVIDALYQNAFDKLYFYTVPNLKKVAKGEQVD